MDSTIQVLPLYRQFIHCKLQIMCHHIRHTVKVNKWQWQLHSKLKGNVGNFVTAYVHTLSSSSALSLERVWSTSCVCLRKACKTSHSTIQDRESTKYQKRTLINLTGSLLRIWKNRYKGCYWNGQKKRQLGGEAIAVVYRKRNSTAQKEVITHSRKR